MSVICAPYLGAFCVMGRRFVDEDDEDGWNPGPRPPEDWDITTPTPDPEGIPPWGEAKNRRRANVKNKRRARHKRL